MKDDNHIVFFVDPKWRRPGPYSPFLIPWWGNFYDESSVFSREMFNSYSFDTRYYSMTSDISEADAIFVPYNHSWLLRNDKQLLQKCIETARDHGLPLLLDGSGDIEIPIRGRDIYVLRYGGYRFMPEENRIGIPLFTDDLLERCLEGQPIVREKSVGKPIVGFAGWASMSTGQIMRTWIKELPILAKSVLDERYLACRKGIIWRRKAIGNFRQSDKIALNVRIRKSFSANPKTAQDDMRKLRREMVDVISNSDYALDLRGDGNNSARLFEILSLGRIPVIVDTERHLPFKDRVDYGSFALIVDFRDIEKLPEIVSEFHKNVSDDRFKEKQKNARDAYVKYFRIDAIMKYVIEDFRRKALRFRSSQAPRSGI